MNHWFFEIFLFFIFIYYKKGNLLLRILFDIIPSFIYKNKKHKNKIKLLNN